MDSGPLRLPGDLEQVKCLGCGVVYVKPALGGSVERNPGCPVCRYVGWVPVSGPEPRPQLRSGEDRPQYRAGRSH
jgi:hypothetical protein